MDSQFYYLPELFYEWFDNYPLFIKNAIVISFCSISLFLIAVHSLFLKRILDTYHEKRINKASTLISVALTNELMHEGKVADQHFNESLISLQLLSNKNKLYKQVLIDLVMFYHLNFTDQTGKRLNELFNKLNLIESSVKKLKNGAWKLRVQGLKEMQQLVAPEARFNYLVYPLLDHENNDLRIEAQIAHIRLNKDQPFAFLAYTSAELLPWHQILLYEFITNTPDLAVPKFNKYLQSENESVCAFCLKLIAYYHQLEAIPTLINLLSHPSTKIRAATIEVLAKLDAEEAEDKMIARYANEDLLVQSQILKAIGEIGSGKSLAFLSTQFLESDNFDIIKAAGYALANYPSFNKNKLLSALKADHASGSLQKETIINHCLNNLIRN